MGRCVYVLSDLHLGPGGALSSFHEEVRLGRLLETWGVQRDGFELILAGDVFDFLQIEGYDGFDAARAPERFESLLRHPGTAAVINSLKTLASRPGIELTVLAGNHDPELLVPAVRAELEARLGRSGTVRWADDRPLVARAGERPAIWGRAVGPDGDPGRQVWVVHGDRWDPANAIDRDAVQTAVAAGSKVELPVGSHLVFEVLSKLKLSHRWVDEMKPELQVVLPLLLAIAPGETARYMRDHLGVAGRLVVAQLRALFRAGPLFGDQATAEQVGDGGPPPVGESIARALAAELADAGTSAQNRVLAELEPLLTEGILSTEGGDTLSAASGLRGVLLRAWLRLVRQTDRFGRIDGPDGTAAAARRYLPPGLGALVAGHTHGPRIRSDLAPPYFNSGTWTPTRTIPADVSELLDSLLDPAAPRVPSPGTYVRIDLGGDAPRVAVEEAPP